MKVKDETDYAGELVATLIRLEELHTELEAVIEKKISCMKTCDVPGMNECTAGERELVGQINNAEGHRLLLTDRVARSCGLSVQKVRRMNADELAKQVQPAKRADLLTVSNRLRSLTTRIARRNHVAGTLSTRMLGHMDSVLTAMTAPKEGSGAYTPAGRTAGSASRQLFETVG